jgi:hypothetical protein
MYNSQQWLGEVQREAGGNEEQVQEKGDWIAKVGRLSACVLPEAR